MMPCFIADCYTQSVELYESFAGNTNNCGVNVSGMICICMI